MTRKDKLEALGFALDRVPGAAAAYLPVVIVDNLAHVSGCLPFDGPGNLVSRGQLGRELTVELGRQAAALCAANVLRVVHQQVGTLERIERVVRLGGYVNSAPGFSEQHLVINGASELMMEVLGDAGKHARSAIGTAGLPLGASVEVDAVIALSGGSS